MKKVLSEKTTLASSLFLVSMLFAPTFTVSAEAYKLISAQEPMCGELLKKLNKVGNDSSMMCVRKLPDDPNFKLPDWKAVGTEEAYQVALALEKARASMGPPSELWQGLKKSSRA